MPYRVEVAKQGRAGCKNAECKKAAIKIAKGEFRFGTLVTIEEHTSWTWKHWGCVTPVQVAGFINESGGDIDMVDGYEELPAEFQQKIDFALANGHVPDEDWKGDVECNRPGMKGFRKKVPAAEKKKGKKEDEGDEPEADETKPKKKRGRVSKDEDQDEAPAPKKARGKKAAVKAEEPHSDTEAPKARGKKGSVKKEEPTSEVEAPKPKAKKVAKGKPAPIKEEEERDEDVDDEAADKPPKPQAKKSKSSKAQTKSHDQTENSEGAMNEMPKSKAQREKKAAPAVTQDTPAPKKRGRKKASIEHA